MENIHGLYVVPTVNTVGLSHQSETSLAQTLSAVLFSYFFLNLAITQSSHPVMHNDNLKEPAIVCKDTRLVRRR